MGEKEEELVKSLKVINERYTIRIKDRIPIDESEVWRYINCGRGIIYCYFASNSEDFLMSPCDYHTSQNFRELDAELGYFWFIQCYSDIRVAEKIGRTLNVVCIYMELKT